VLVPPTADTFVSACWVEEGTNFHRKCDRQMSESCPSDIGFRPPFLPQGWAYRQNSPRALLRKVGQLPKRRFEDEAGVADAMVPYHLLPYPTQLLRSWSLLVDHIFSLGYRRTPNLTLWGEVANLLLITACDFNCCYGCIVYNRCA
jgi:hypothetical protein